VGGDSLIPETKRRVLSVAVASIQPAAVVYREEQNFDWWVYALLTLIEIVVCLSLVTIERQGHEPFTRTHVSPVLLSAFGLVGLGVPMLVAIGFLRMTTEVTPSDLRIWFGFVPTYRRFVSIGSIRRIEVVSFRPLVEHGGWGIRNGRNGERVLTARGTRGVRIELIDGPALIVGSQRPEELAVAIEQAMRPGS
jgi:hypothetical protein